VGGGREPGDEPQSMWNPQRKCEPPGSPPPKAREGSGEGGGGGGSLGGGWEGGPDPGTWATKKGERIIPDAQLASFLSEQQGNPR